VPALKLEIVDGAGAGTCVELDGALEIGRDKAAGLRLTDKLVSRRHARIRAGAAGVVIEDLGSSNGTYVNGKEIVEPTPLAAGDRLLIGSCVILVGDAGSQRAPEVNVRAEPAPVAAGPPPGSPAGDERLVGSVVAEHRILGVIARGGMGVVYRAEHLRLKRVVALKLLPPEMASVPGFQERFESESRVAAAIDHPNIVPLYDAGTADGLPFLTMRFVDGLDLDGLLRRDGPLEMHRAISIVRQVASALDAAHASGLVHRDVKPANVLVASGGGPEASDHCYLTDFGLTRDLAVARRLTNPGEFVGTVDYAAPEQIKGATASGAADQYALGCVLYECLVGQPPFHRRREIDVMRAHLNDDPPAVSARKPGVPRGIDDVVARALAKDPAHRFASCVELTTAARAATDRRRRPRNA
jgi:hypothetical protein